MFGLLYFTITVFSFVFFLGFFGRSELALEKLGNPRPAPICSLSPVSRFSFLNSVAERNAQWVVDDDATEGLDAVDHILQVSFFSFELFKV